MARALCTRVGESRQGVAPSGMEDVAWARIDGAQGAVEGRRVGEVDMGWLGRWACVEGGCCTCTRVL